MKLLLDGKQRNIYFRKDNTAYYKKNGIENNITEYFKKTGELKKTYSNLLVKSETVNNVKKKKKKMITGGGAILDIFDPITIEFITGSECLHIKNLRKLCEHLIYIVIIVKIQFDINGGNNPFNMDYGNLTKYLNLIIAIMNNLFGNNINLSNIDNKIEDIKKIITNLEYDTIFKKIEHVHSSITDINADCDNVSNAGYGIVAALIKANIF
jgi:hypothetical protein